MSMENRLNARYTWEQLVAHQEALRKLKGMMDVLTDDVNEFMEFAIVRVNLESCVWG
jgi:hypothetical protein